MSYTLDPLDLQGFLRRIHKHVAPPKGEVLMLVKPRHHDGKVTFPARRWPWGTSVPDACSHIDLGIYNDQRGSDWARRTGKEQTARWGVVLDDVGSDKVSQRAPCEPTYIIETRPGSQQHVYMFDKPMRGAVGKTLVRGLTRALIDAKMSDPGARSITQLTRLPGSQPPGKPIQARLIEWSGWVYEAEGMADEFHVKLPDMTYQARFAHDQATARNDPLLKWMLDEKLIISGPNQDGWYTIPCPWAHDHGDDIKTAGYLPGSKTNTPAFYCFHAHSKAPGGTRPTGWREFLAWTREQRLKKVQGWGL